MAKIAQVSNNNKFVKKDHKWIELDKKDIFILFAHIDENRQNCVSFKNSQQGVLEINRYNYVGLIRFISAR